MVFRGMTSPPPEPERKNSPGHAPRFSRPTAGYYSSQQRLPVQKKIAIIAALNRELSSLVADWPSVKVHHDGHDFTFHQSSYAVAVCGGIGYEAARRAAEAAIAKYSPDLLISAGIAGALVPELHVGETIFPATVIDAEDNSRHETAIRNSPLSNTALGRTLLVSHSEIASVSQKLQLAKSYGAHAVDMEAAAVARAAQKHNLQFLVIKAISDELNFAMPEINRFISTGQFETRTFALYIAVRPWLWLKVVRLARNTRLATDNLCAWLRESALTNTIVTSTPKP
jgi:adenosylhomocysteine nucleosidase